MTPALARGAPGPAISPEGAVAMCSARVMPLSRLSDGAASGRPRRLLANAVPSGLLFPRGRSPSVGQVEKLASISQADPRVAHFDVVLALLFLFCLPREGRAPGRHAPRALGFGPRCGLDFGSHRPSSQMDGPRPVKIPLPAWLSVRGATQCKLFFAPSPSTELLSRALIFIPGNGTDPDLLV